MRALIQITLLALLTTATTGFAQTKKAGYTVCTATINSSEERETFKKHLKGQNFNFVELTDFSEAKNKNERGGDWFEKACQAQVQCDVLVVSGHYGGSFFGDSGFSLSTDAMEEQSCKNTCSGILDQPKEVFLFGCNTLATKEKDHRSPQDYLQVLLQDGIGRADAERIVQARYGALGDSNKDRMRRIFSGAKRIYGFDSVGPSGKTVKPFLDRYFKRVPDYQGHLLKVDAEKLISAVDKFNRAARGLSNTVLAEVLRPTAFAQCTGLSKHDPAYQFKKDICKLYDDRISRVEKVKAMESMLKSPNRLLYLPSISAYLRKNREDLRRDPMAKYALESMATPELQKEIEQLIASLNGSPALQIDLLHLKVALGMIDEEQYKARAKTALKGTLKKLSGENVDLLCSIQADNQLNLEVSAADLNLSDLSTPQGVTAFHCIKTRDTRITKEALKAFARPTPPDQLALMLTAAANLPGHDSELSQVALKHRNSTSDGIPEASRKLLIFKGAPEERLRELQTLMEHPGQVWLASSFVQDANLKDEVVGELALKQIHQTTDPGHQMGLVEVFATVTPRDSTIWDHLPERLGTRDEGLNSQIAHHLLKSEHFSPQLTSWAVDNAIAASNSGSRSVFLQVIASAPLSKPQVDRMITLIRTKPDSPQAQGLRDILLKRSDLSLTPEQDAVLGQ